jgi:hypothetical protein
MADSYYLQIKAPKELFLTTSDQKFGIEIVLSCLDFSL